ncbi:uncharacterized protein DDB_G0287625 [Glossina fuscipes]|uniref:Uncharacterized protein DDB_G0287625 n=1 Tax=Glossina fuscipes TaxID=7396 RepID=A0A9C5ZAX2_9MUSC|nr:uncharacterized protein DDB_G0287625 [Glossina fuscipes]
MPNNRMRSDDFDIESADRSGRMERRRSNHNVKSYKRSYRNDSRSRSRSVERHRRRQHRGAFSRSRSRSRSRGGYSSRHDRRQSFRRHRDSRTRSRSRSRSHRRYQREMDDLSRRRSCSRSSSQLDDDRCRSSKKECRSSNKIQNSDLHTHSKPCSLTNIAEDTRDDTGQHTNDLNELPLPERSCSSTESYQENSYYNFDTDEPIDKERIHREMEEKLRQTLAKEGKVYPPPKPEASHPVFANDGSFLEIFKKMQEQQKQQASTSAVAANVVPVVPVLAVANPTTVPYLAATAMGKSAPPPPIVGRRRGGKILKTGVVAKPKVQNEPANDPKDFWSLYLAEVNKYKNTACESEAGNRPLVK